MTSLAPDLARLRRRVWLRPSRSAIEAAPAAAADRLPVLDGLRGLMTIFVMVSHVFGEVPHGPSVFRLGWVAVQMFFVLSGFLVGRLIIRRRGAANFLPVFFLRRVMRTFPIYFVCVVVILGVLALVGPLPSGEGPAPLPSWSYFVFLQNVFIVMRSTVGQPWLAPTWTLALEEQFYLLVPWLFLLAPRRAWLPVLAAVCCAGLAARALGVLTGPLMIAPLAVLPSSADVLASGLLLAVAVDRGLVDTTRWTWPARIVPVVCLAATMLLLDAGARPADQPFKILGPFLVSLGCASFILSLIQGAPEARRFQAPLLRFFGRISYAVYLTHLAVLGLLHRFILGGAPDVQTPAEVAVGVLALPCTVAVAWLLTEVVEQPLSRWAHRWQWRGKAIPDP